MKSQKFLSAFAITAVIFLSIFVSPILTKTFAIEYGGIGGKPANPNPDNPRTKSIFIFNLAGGESVEDAVLIVNNTQESKTLLVYATDSQKSSDGSFACEQFTDSKDGVGNWIQLSKSELTLEPSTNEEIPFTISIPENVDVGEINGCIMIQEKKATIDNPEASGVSLSFRTGLRVVVTVPGEQIRKLEITEFDTSFDGNIIKTKMNVQNTGNVSIDTDVNIKMNSIIGTEVMNVSNEFPILRGEVSTYNIEIERPFWGGFFTLHPSVSYDPSTDAQIGIENEEAKTTINFASKSIFIMPTIGALIIELLILIIVLALIYYFIKQQKLKKQIANKWTTYKVNSGDTINSVSDKYNVDWKLLAKANRIRPPYTLQVGSNIKVPGSSSM